MTDTENNNEFQQQKSPNINHLRIQTHRDITITRQPPQDDVNNVQFSSPRTSTSENTTTTMFPMMSSPTHPCPDSPWTLSSISPPPNPSPSLLYHCIASLHRHEGNIYAIAASKGLVFTGSNSARIRVWKQPDCMDKGYLKASSGEVRAILAYSNTLFSTHKDHKIRIWNFTVSDTFKSKKVYTEDSHTLTMTLKFQPSPVNALALSSSFNHCFLYSGSSDGMINFWEKERLCYRFNHGGFLQGHRFAVLCLATVGNLVFSGSEDTTIRVWRREEGSCYHECLAVLDGHRGPVRCLAACLQMEKVVLGFLVYSASLDQTFKVWRIKILSEDNDEKMCLEYDATISSSGREGRVKVRDYDMSPVLSPSWVEKKLQGTYFH
ncbi:uncharacterized protein DS421_10g306770 [Arachis hypogaea]|nr:uncharacterized protein DS421_10g306770 [Arachis hypogaea]